MNYTVRRVRVAILSFKVKLILLRTVEKYPQATSVFSVRIINNNNNCRSLLPSFAVRTRVPVNVGGACPAAG